MYLFRDVEMFPTRFEKEPLFYNFCAKKIEVPVHDLENYVLALLSIMYHENT